MTSRRIPANHPCGAYHFDASQAFNPRSVVDCRNCLASFALSEIGSEPKLIDYVSSTAPQFPPDGQQMECHYAGPKLATPARTCIPGICNPQTAVPSLTMQRASSS